jgi:hypothetical protein
MLARRPHTRRRLLIVACLLGYLAGGVGLPLPSGDRTAKDHSQPYPCMDHPCGCATAEQCWRHCCCFTPEEKFVWAAAHGVTPPAYAERPSGGWHTARLRDREAGNSAPEAGCCACAAHQADGVGAGCCQSPARPAADSPKALGRYRWVVGAAALRCRGLSTFWVSAGAALRPPPLVTWRPSWAPTGRSAEVSLTASRLARTPPIPPPRLLLL